MEYLKDIQTAIDHIDKKYFVWKDYGTTSIVEKMQERVFCYEFYHQFRKIMENNGDKYGNLTLTAEIGKYYAEKCNKQAKKYPDFVLHEGQDNISQQEFVIEVKTEAGINKDNMCTDICKLISCRKELNYKYGIFVGVNMSVQDIEKILNKIVISQNVSEECILKDDICKDKIYFLGTKSLSAPFTLAEYLDKVSSNGSVKGFE